MAAMKLERAISILLAVWILVPNPLQAQEKALPVPDRALFEAARQDDAELAAFAIERGASLTARNEHGHTPLHVAAIFDAAVSRRRRGW